MGPLAFLVGWIAMAGWLETRALRRTPPPTAPVCEWVLGSWPDSESSWPERVAPEPLHSPLALRAVPGVGRLRARRLAEASWSQNLQAGQPSLLEELMALPGIGPVTASRVVGWATQWAHGAYPFGRQRPYTGVPSQTTDPWDQEEPNVGRPVPDPRTPSGPSDLWVDTAPP